MGLLHTSKPSGVNDVIFNEIGFHDNFKVIESVTKLSNNVGVLIIMDWNEISRGERLEET